MSRLLATPNLEVEAKIDQDLLRARLISRRFFGPALVGLYLGGGYGRGEGGQRLVQGGWAPENDYDLFALVRGGKLEARLWRWRVERQLIGELLAGQAMEYEVGVIGERALMRQRPSQMLHDLRQGHLCLWGDCEALLELPCEDPAGLPPAEGIRLLVNRGALLVLAAEAEAQGQPLPAVRLDRFLEKARLAVGDAWLLLQGRHHHLLRERAARVQREPLLELPQADLWRARHASAARAKLEGFSAPPAPETLSRALEQLLPAYREALDVALARVQRQRRRWPFSSDVCELGLALSAQLRQRRGGQDFLSRWRAA